MRLLVHIIEGKKPRCIFPWCFFFVQRTQKHTSTVEKIKFVFEKKCILSGSTIYPTAPNFSPWKRNIFGKVGKFKVKDYYLKLIYVTCYLSSSCHVTHKASTQSRQPALSAAAICTSPQFFHPAFFLSLSAVFLRVVFGLHRFRRPSGVQVNAVLQSLFGSFLMM